VVAVLQPLKHDKPIPIDRAVVLVGRGEDCDVVISGSKKISRKHCCLVHFDQSFLIRDLGSTNGVWVNGKRVDRESEMTDGDRIAIGDVQFQFFPQGLRQSAGKVASRASRSVVSENANQPDEHIEIMNSDSPDELDDVQGAIEIIDEDPPDDDLLDDDLLDDDLLDDDLLDDGIIYDEEDDDLIDDEDLTTNTPSEPLSKPKGRPFRGGNESEPVIDLEDSFADEEIEDIIVFDDE
jgi:pSer/pThr/pTyr-binding forkhead associated (FHA) protein